MPISDECKRVVGLTVFRMAIPTYNYIFHMVNIILVQQMI